MAMECSTMLSNAYTNANCNRLKMCLFDVAETEEAGRCRVHVVALVKSRRFDWRGEAVRQINKAKNTPLKHFTYCHSAFDTAKLFYSDFTLPTSGGRKQTHSPMKCVNLGIFGLTIRIVSPAFAQSRQ